MGTYWNPGNNGYQEILQSEYVDKTGLIALINHTVGTMAKKRTALLFGVMQSRIMVCRHREGRAGCSIGRHIT